MSEKQDLFSGVQEVQERHRFDAARLEDYMKAHVEGFKGPLTVFEFKGGQSNPTYALKSPSGEYVLRRKPPGTLLKSAHAVDREYRVLNALQETPVPTPRVYCLCTDEDVIGTWFYVMEKVPGRVFWENHMPGEPKEVRHEVYLSMVRAMAALHSVDYEAVGLGDFGRPGNYFARQISRWSKQYTASITDDIPEMTKLMEWLPENIPDDPDTSIIHGDFKLDNVLIHPTEPRVVAVLDWELSTIGHPMGDFSYLMMPWKREDGFPEVDDIAAYGLPTAEEMTAEYCRLTGREPLRDDEWDFYVAYNLFRSAAILQGILGRVRDGTASSEHAVELANNVRPMAEQAWAIVEQIGKPA